MKRLIRQRRFKHFLTPSGTWTKDAGQAQVFATDDAARVARNDFRLEDCELYYLIGDEPSPSDFAMLLEQL